jgi:hypothetical protein
MLNCPLRNELQREAMDALQVLIDLTKMQQEAIQQNDMKRLESLDLKLENTFGVKERAFGAIRQHMQEHGCGGGPPDSATAKP